MTTDAELKQLIESNARAIRAMLDARAEERQEFRERIDHLQEAMVQLVSLQDGVNRMLASLDEDRPTVLSKADIH